MQKIFITVAVGLVLNLPSTILGQSTESSIRPGDRIELRVGGAVRNPGVFSLEPTATISRAVAMAGGPRPQAQGDKVWLFRDGKIVTTILGETARLEDAQIRSGDRLFVVWESPVPERSWISRNGGFLGTLLAATVATVVVFSVK